MAMEATPAAVRRIPAVNFPWNQLSLRRSMDRVSIANISRQTNRSRESGASGVRGAGVSDHEDIVAKKLFGGLPRPRERFIIAETRVHQISAAVVKTAQPATHAATCHEPASSLPPGRQQTAGRLPAPSDEQQTADAANNQPPTVHRQSPRAGALWLTLQRPRCVRTKEDITDNTLHHDHKCQVPRVCGSPKVTRHARRTRKERARRPPSGQR